MKVSASKICNDSIHKKIAFVRGETARNLLLLTVFDWINKMMNESDEVWKWVHQKYVIGLIIQKLHSIEEVKLVLPFCYQQCLIELTKKLMRVMKYEDEWIKICNESIHTKIGFIRGGGGGALYLYVTDYAWLDQPKNEW